jgi:hypothetical protein
MENKPFKSITVTRPQDRSLEAYKAWMMDLAKKLTTGSAELKWTEEEWITNWKKYWKKSRLNKICSLD